MNFIFPNLLEGLKPPTRFALLQYMCPKDLLLLLFFRVGLRSGTKNRLG